MTNSSQDTVLQSNLLREIANEILKLQAVSGEKKSKKKQGSNLINCCGDVAEESCECVLSDCSCNGCDFPELDCGSCELDCSPDFGSCGS
ncbi:MAG: hypothetical protein F6K54_02605 [Okeania sp. SIO3B5]|uniref:hypothetical protein n=1 Tax=Okeania sp. SIO3B5 TaxID=2607811 RepID=UPI0014017204|nr:hypothetical protein [Okeania sp. SIO3B5]NEO52068.1 hypothetical protein [Okeania sp. SIO3B5]